MDDLELARVVSWCECVITTETEQRAMDVWQAKLSEVF